MGMLWAMGTEVQQRRAKLWGLLGDLPERHRPISARTLRVEEREGYRLETLALDLNGLEEVPAYLVKPLGRDGNLPTVLFNHAHWGQYDVGKEELLSGRPGYAEPLVQKPAWGKALTDAGYAALCIDHWCFGQRCAVGAGGAMYPSTRPEQGNPELETFKRMLWDGRVMWGMMVYDSVRAMDYLCSRPDVDAGRIGTLGMSMGSTMAWWLSALDERVKVCMDICCLTDIHTFRRQAGPLGHGIFYFVPGLLKHFTTAQINALIAPRPHLAVAGNLDPLTPPEGLDAIDGELRRVYGTLGAGEAWKLVREDVPHMETPRMRAEALVWLKRWL